MRPQRFQEFCLTALTAPDIKSVDAWSEPGSRPFGLEVTFTSGSRLWLGITATGAPGDNYDQPEVPVTGACLPGAPWPNLYDITKGHITPHSAERYLAAAVTNMGSPEIARVWAYSARDTPPSHPGVGAEFHSGARIFLPLIHTARPEQQRGQTAFRLQESF
ncbi:hypothetical protein ACWD0J_27045 [Streptomyces sp. NPDC003011]